MNKRVIDSHIHFDLYKKDEQSLMLQETEAYEVDALIGVSNHLQSARRNLAFARQYSKLKVAFGYHPEQPIPTEAEIEHLRNFINEHQNEMIAIGEVGLPYYLRKENPQIPLEPYISMLEKFIVDAKRLDKPIVLHAVYEDAPLVCSLLEKHDVQKAHFHWFKGDSSTVEKMIKNRYFISITPDVLYEQEIQDLVINFPLNQMMVETDGPWPFEGPFQNQMTHPKMMHETIRKIAKLKNIDLANVYEQIYLNTKSFYGLK
ncbi:TatD DNase family protein [Salirhabdus euzebyi]|uniref:TatD DNase family protein n=1 Tax=Salirhabdus euzebyi TaxID=394506 RepID=A0A841Q4E2_9BACI|nr:TatD family hydrolase [Salirhabdus euzebyi]MBB6453222.1 TatD DNase family protein [Salirhabdus euzebyi]